MSIVIAFLHYLMLLWNIYRYEYNSGPHEFCHRLHWPSEDNDRHFIAFVIRCRKHSRAIIERLGTKCVAFVVVLALIVCNHVPQYQRSFPSNRDHICTEIHSPCLYSFLYVLKFNGTIARVSFQNLTRCAVQEYAQFTIVIVCTIRNFMISRNWVTVVRYLHQTGTMDIQWSVKSIRYATAKPSDI